MPKKRSQKSDDENSSQEEYQEKPKSKTNSKTDITQNKKLNTRNAKKADETTSASNSFFAGFDLSNFWDDHEPEEEPPTDAQIKSVEKDLGYKLPGSYIALMKQQNGGIPKNKCFPTNQKTSWAKDHIAIETFFSIGTLCDEQENWIQEWQYPDTGVYICDCPSGGHDMVMLDYEECGKNGEPKVVHVDQEPNYKKTVLADNFEAFVRGLKNESEFDI